MSIITFHVSRDAAQVFRALCKDSTHVWQMCLDKLPTVLPEGPDRDAQEEFIRKQLEGAELLLREGKYDAAGFHFPVEALQAIATIWHAGLTVHAVHLKQVISDPDMTAEEGLLELKMTDKLKQFSREFLEEYDRLSTPSGPAN